jgi:hypothetical protein
VTVVQLQATCSSIALDPAATQAPPPGLPGPAHTRQLPAPAPTRAGLALGMGHRPSALWPGI